MNSTIGMAVEGTITGGITGGVASVISGGDFKQGFVTGAKNGAIGFVANDFLHEKLIPTAKNAWNKLTEGRRVFSSNATYTNFFKTYDMRTGEQIGISSTVLGQSMSISMGLNLFPGEDYVSFSMETPIMNLSIGFTYSCDNSGAINSLTIDVGYGWGFSAGIVFDVSTGIAK